MSLCLPARRTHFWIDDARGGSNGTGSSARKYGTNCIIPECVNMGAVGCVGMRLAEGTSACPWAVKNSFQVRRSVTASMTDRAYRRGFTRLALDRPSGAAARGVPAQL